MRHLKRTPPFRGPDGRVLPGSIAEARYLRLGGMDQWVMIRGENAANPPLVVLHGGPGMSETFFFRARNAPLERGFTVVYWEQRGTGRSFDSAIPRSSMTVERFVADLDELVAAVRQRTGHRKVALLGHSWGSLLGALYAARFPDKVSVYVGSAQIGDAAAAEAASYAWTLGEAERRGNRRALRELRAIGPPPYDARALMKERTWASRFEGMAGVRGLLELARMFLAAPESSVFDLPGMMRGFRFSLDALWAEASALNLADRVPALPMPVFFFLGRKDRWVPPETSMAYVQALAAPSKTIVWFDQSGHQMFADEPGRFNASMLRLVRPVATAVPAAHRTRPDAALAGSA
jgi:pimeloyl-ACP methyl ester carboxylesterase